MISELLLYFIVVPLGILVAAILLYRFVSRPRFDFPKGCYVAPATSWKTKFFGQVYDLIRQEGGAPQLRWMEAAQKEGKSVIGYDFTFGMRAITVLHPADAQYLLTGDAEYSLVKHAEYERLGEMLGKFGLVTLRDEKVHAEQRRLCAPAFQSRLLNAIANYIVPKHAVDLDSDFAASTGVQEGVQLSQIFDKFTLGVIVEAAFKKLSVAGINIGDEFRKLQNSIGLSAIDLLPRWLSAKIPTERRKIANSVRDRIKVVTGDMLSVVRKQHEAGEVKPGTEVLLDFLAREQNLDEQMAADNLLTFLVAGHETTSRALQWTTMYLSQNPRVQERLYEELCDAVALHTQPSLDDLKDCSYLEMVVKESLRLSPPVPLVGRESIEDITLPHSGVVIPKGCRVTITIFLLHRNTEIWGEDAAVFRPERWEDEKTKAMCKRFPCAWTPFLQGNHRSCIGATFAWNELLIGVASIVRSFKLEWPEGQAQPKRKWAITQRPNPDPKIRIVSRHS